MARTVRKLAKTKFGFPDLALAGGFSSEDSEDGVFKAINMGRSSLRADCMGRALMISGMVGKNIGE